LKLYKQDKEIFKKIEKQGSLSQLKELNAKMKKRVAEHPEIEKNYKELNRILDGFVADKAEFARLAGFRW